jgi:hypothetical protein
LEVFPGPDNPLGADRASMPPGRIQEEASGLRDQWGGELDDIRPRGTDVLKVGRRGGVSSEGEGA